jgi:hypothetical protein
VGLRSHAPACAWRQFERTITCLLPNQGALGVTACRVIQFLPRLQALTPGKLPEVSSKLIEQRFCPHDCEPCLTNWIGRPLSRRTASLARDDRSPVWLPCRLRLPSQ